MKKEKTGLSHSSHISKFLGILLAAGVMSACILFFYPLSTTDSANFNKKPVYKRSQRPAEAFTNNNSQHNGSFNSGPTEFLMDLNDDSDWIYPVTPKVKGTFSVKDKTGKKIFVESFSEEDDKIIWHGSDNDGNVLSTGTYSFLVEYHNGSKEKGLITLLN